MITKVEGSNYLAELRDRLKDEHAAVAKALKTSLKHALTAGDILIEAKARLKHGEWLPWIASCGLSVRTAQRYMSLARNRPEIEAQIRHVSYLDIAGALAMIVVPRVLVPAVDTAFHHWSNDALDYAADTAFQHWDDATGPAEAEAARREVIFDAIESNVDSITALAKRWVPNGYQPRRSNPEIQKLFDGLMKTVASVDDKYALAVECGDHAHALALVSWVYGLSHDMRSMCEAIARSAERRMASNNTGIE